MDGNDGQDGADGTIGATGSQGVQGVAGNDGVNGTNGVDGAVGATGAQGLQGLAGNNGADGTNGTNGVDGNDGQDGADGSIGATGSQGIQGVAGNDGGDGANGTNGVDGIDGTNGVDGATGPQGPEGTFQTGTETGEMVFWDGNDWVSISPGNEDENLTFCNGRPIWGPCPEIPTVVTNAVSNATENSVQANANVTADGGRQITSRGVVWGTSSMPTIEQNTDSLTLPGELGTFSLSITGLVVGTTYYIRSFAVNEVGIAYGNEVTFTPSLPLEIGQFYQGGYIAYIFQLGDNGTLNGPGYVSGEQHGVIAAPSWISSTGVPWGCASSADAFSSQGGQTVSNEAYAEYNTNQIVQYCGTNTAAQACLNYSNGGYSDWFLPTSDELYRIHSNLHSPGLVVYPTFYSYWSSTATTNGAQALYFNSAIGTYPSQETRSLSLRVIPIRYF